MLPCVKRQSIPDRETLSLAQERFLVHFVVYAHNAGRCEQFDHDLLFGYKPSSYAGKRVPSNYLLPKYADRG